MLGGDHRPVIPDTSNVPLIWITIDWNNVLRFNRIEVDAVVEAVHHSTRSSMARVSARVRMLAAMELIMSSATR